MQKTSSAVVDWRLKQSLNDFTEAQHVITLAVSPKLLPVLPLHPSIHSISFLLYYALHIPMGSWSAASYQRGPGRTADRISITMSPLYGGNYNQFFVRLYR